MINKTEQEIMSMWEGNINEPIVSICCTTYNHAYYIGEALDSFLSQETNFPFEIVVHDDASVDNTSLILKEYEIKYPLIIKPIYEKNNLYSKNDNSLMMKMYSCSRGKYLALCEGDDFWIANDKLQKQYNIIRNDKTISAVVHNTEVVNCENGIKSIYNKEINNDLFIDFKRIIRWSHYPPFHSSSIFMKKELYIVPEKISMKSIGDYPLALWLGINGKIFFLNEAMSEYRLNVPNSWSKRTSNDNASFINMHNEKIQLLVSIDNYLKKRYHAVISEEILYGKCAILLANGFMFKYYVTKICYCIYCLWNSVFHKDV